MTDPAKKQVFKLRPLVATEAQTQAAIIQYLEFAVARGEALWFARINGGATQAGNRFIKFYHLHGFGEPKSKGISDIIGLMADGRALAIEVKKVGEKPTSDQADYLARVKKGGGVAVVAYSLSDVTGALSGRG